MTSVPPDAPPPSPTFSSMGYVDLRAMDFVREQPVDMPASEVVRQATELGLELDLATVYRVREKERAKRRIVKPKESTMPETEASPPEAEASAAEKTTEAPAAPPVQKARRGRPPKGEETKAGFVRALSLDLSAKEVVEQAKAKGLELSEAYVYAVRAKQAKPAKTEEPKKRGRKPKGEAQASESEAPVELKKRGRKPKEAAPVQSKAEEAAPPAKAPLFTRPAEESAQEVEVEFAKLALEIGLVRADQLLVQLKSKLTEMLRQ